VVKFSGSALLPLKGIHRCGCCSVPSHQWRLQTDWITDTNNCSTSWV